VLIYIPPDPDPKADFRLVYHFHGTHSEHMQRKAPGVPKKKWVGWNRLQQTMAAIDDLQGRGPHNVALVYPFSAGKRREPARAGWNNREYDRMWMRPDPAPGFTDAFADLHAQVRALLVDEFGVHAGHLPARVLAEGHSAGGIALRNIAASGTPLVEEYLFLDASFQDWADGCWAAIQEHKLDARVTIVVTERGIADPFAGRDPWCTRLAAEAALQAECTEGREHPPSAPKRSCDELREAARSQPRYEAWCAGLESDMKDTPGVRIHRTRISHGEQPRHFSGGLELPAPPPP
jgi:hypothetical protein